MEIYLDPVEAAKKDVLSPAFGSHQAYLFWKNVICDYTGTDLEIEDGIFVFSNRIDKRDDYVCPYWE